MKTVEFIYLSSTFCWWILRPTITIRFDSKWKNTIRTALNSTLQNSRPGGWNTITRHIHDVLLVFVICQRYYLTTLYFDTLFSIWQVLCHVDTVDGCIKCWQCCKVCVWYVPIPNCNVFCNMDQILPAVTVACLSMPVVYLNALFLVLMSVREEVVCAYYWRSQFLCNS